MSPESKEHVTIKTLLEKKLREWYGASIKEYYEGGHELDVYAVLSNNIDVYIEVIWSKSNFTNDMLLIERSNAKIKLVIVNYTFIDENKIREYEKTKISQKKKGSKISPSLIDGSHLLENDENTLSQIKQIIDDFVNDLNENIEDYSLSVLEAIKAERIINNSDPSIEIVLNPTETPLSNVYVPDDAGAWIVSHFPFCLSVIPRRTYFDCTMYYDAKLKVYVNGTIHFIIPLQKNHYNKLAIDFIMHHILSYLIYTSRSLINYNYKSSYCLSYYLYNCNNSEIMFDDSITSMRGTNTLPSNPNPIQFKKYVFNPSSSELFSIMKTIYRDICTEAGFIYISDDTIKKRLEILIKNNEYYRTLYIHENKQIPKISIDFK